MRTGPRGGAEVKYLVAHAPWAPGRARALARLMELLPPGVEVVKSLGPEHASIWSRRLWERAAVVDGADAGDLDGESVADHVCLLNDDVTADVAAIERAAAAVPDEPLSLHANNPNTANIAGGWARCYHYSGPGVVLPPGAAQSLLEFTYALPWSLLSRWNEDMVAIAWAWSRQRPFWYPLPSPVRHDVAVPSTLGYDAHPDRTPTVTGPPRDLTVADRDAVPFVELPWADTRALRYRHTVLRAGRTLCSLCLGREGVVGTPAVQLCTACLLDLNSAAVRALG